MVSEGVCFNGSGRLHFVADTAKINADYYVCELLPTLVDDCELLMPDGYTFQQDGAPAQDWLEQNTPDFIREDEWPPNSPDLNLLDFHIWGATVHRYQQRVPKLQLVAELREVLKTIWNNFPQDSIQKAILVFRERLKECIEAEGGHFEHPL